MTIVSNVDEAPLRSDAERNLRQIRSAALAVISERGTDVGMEEIAQRAGVGVGTLYRRFPSKDALVDELLRAILDDLLVVARGAVGRADGSGLAAFLEAIGRSLAAHQGCANLMLRRPARPEQTAEMRRLIVELIDQARRSGAVAEHITVGDVYALIWALRGLVETTASVAPRAWERHLELHLAGLRATPAPTRKRGLTMAQLDAISARRASAVEPDPS